MRDSTFESRARSWVVAPIVLCLTALALIAATEQARAGVAYFCPTGLGAVTIAANSRCVGAYDSGLDQVRSTLTNGSGVSHCAVSKGQSDGLGPNVIPSVCNTLHEATTNCIGLAASYPVQINQSASPHSYFGTKAFYPDCLS